SRNRTGGGSLDCDALATAAVHRIVVHLVRGTRVQIQSDGDPAIRGDRVDEIVVHVITRARDENAPMALAAQRRSAVSNDVVSNDVVSGGNAVPVVYVNGCA